ncbi:MAG: RagB/SusD family nutrient uptake outer membrane protein [Parabacteroides sp.]|nr:RagB/SusD family nutrient uptake outer membrane protein [Parabacteroides sp.]
MKKVISSIILGASLLISGCGTDYLERVPTNSVTDEDLFSTVTGAETALNGIHRSTYAFYDNHGRLGQKAIDIIIDFMADDFLQLERGYGWFVSWYQYLNSRNINSADLEFSWSYYYDIIDNANLILENIDNATDVSFHEDLVKNIKGQAYAYRAYSYWQLVQMFSSRYDYNGNNTQLGVSLVLDNSGDPKPRSSVQEVYEQIYKDIDQAIALLSESNESRPNKSHIDLNVAQGFKARFALTTGDWVTAADMAHQARQGYALTSNYKNGWNDSNNSEWIWGGGRPDR